MEISLGLEKDIGIQCLAKVPYRFHRKLRVISKSWNALLSCSRFYEERQRNGECEEVLVSLKPNKFAETNFNVIIYYPIGHWREILPEIPKEFELDYIEYHRCKCEYTANITNTIT
ncbi:hypothetical protein SUGI_0097920 [Cryptomeria japonica]|nr:hypothetical protein SUGI_0097920 [Cryptomeria japonica]